MSIVHTIFHFNWLHDSILRFDERKCVPVHVLCPYKLGFPQLCPPFGPAKLALSLPRPAHSSFISSACSSTWRFCSSSSAWGLPHIARHVIKRNFNQAWRMLLATS